MRLHEGGSKRWHSGAAVTEDPLHGHEGLQIGLDWPVFRDEVASTEDVDRSVMLVIGVPIGPFGWLDNVGLDTVWHIAENKARHTGALQARAGAERLNREYVDKGWLGVKPGKGFHTYPDSAYARPGFLTGEK